MFFGSRSQRDVRFRSAMVEWSTREEVLAGVALRKRVSQRRCQLSGCSGDMYFDLFEAATWCSLLHFQSQDPPFSVRTVTVVAWLTVGTVCWCIKALVYLFDPLACVLILLFRL